MMLASILGVNDGLQLADAMLRNANTGKEFSAALDNIEHAVSMIRKECFEPKPGIEKMMGYLTLNSGS